MVKHSEKFGHTSLLVQYGFKVVFESNKVVITKNENSIDKGYLYNRFFNLNVMNAP